MALEVSFNYIDDLNINNPNNSPDQVKESANHLRGIKSSVLGSFPNLGQTAVTLTAAQINALATSITPVGGIIMYNGTFAAIPATWQLCDGTNSTPNLTNKFVYGTNTEGQLGDTGGSADVSKVLAHTHTFSGTTDSDGLHSHTVEAGGASGGGVQTDGASFGSPFGTSTNGAHTHTHSGTTDSEGTAGAGDNLPPFYKLAYIRRMS